jgi:hypothetical protein
MTIENDPRQAKKNAELKFIEKAMLDSWRSFRSANNHSEKRGHAMILQAHIEEWLDQPESIPDLEEGVSCPSGCPYRPEDVPDDAEMPFDRGGQTTDAFFFQSGSVTSKIYSRA